jgi:hypothetical protein
MSLVPVMSHLSHYFDTVAALGLKWSQLLIGGGVLLSAVI